MYALRVRVNTNIPFRASEAEPTGIEPITFETFFLKMYTLRVTINTDIPFRASDAGLGVLGSEHGCLQLHGTQRVRSLLPIHRPVEWLPALQPEKDRLTHFHLETKIILFKE